MTIDHDVSPNEPLANGIYAAEVYFGWKLLQWKDGEWWHTELVSRWTASKPVQWIGPFPPLLKKPQSAMPDAGAAPKYDL
jgi:hypothetical protein